MSTALLISPEGIASESETALSERDLSIFQVASMEEGVRSFFEHSHHLVLLDEQLAAAELEELDRLLEECSRTDVPILLLGGADVFELLASRSDTAVADFLSPSPLDAGLLSSKADVLLRVKSRLDQLKEQAVIDELTGTYNRRYFEEQMGVRIEEAKRYDTPFSLVMFDLDHFKVVNDTLGHQFGDHVLRETAAIVRKAVRQEDVLARYGGEEFVIMLPHTDRLGAAILAERVRESIADCTFSRNGLEQNVTMSLGSASMPIDEVDTPEALLELADKRLYEAKSQGRNRTIFE